MEFMMEIKKKVYCGIVSGSDLDNVNQQLRGSGRRLLLSSFLSLSGEALWPSGWSACHWC